MNRTRIAAASGVLCCLFAVVLFASYGLSVWRHGVAFAPSFHVGCFDGAVWFYSDLLPYQGSIIQIDGQPPILRRAGFDFPGIYYRYFQFPTDKLWTLMVSLWYPVFFSAILPALWLFRSRKEG